ncbi:Glycerol-3-phosphate dehydrogenase [NAD(P)+] [Micrococcus lylae]|uniref:Glycerol-3-phosphate dehydrogenase [NAD(P)+] n=1 Tax=Micrococcus lylae TaxID=1273 RepID=A0A1R4J2I7_9MICC|nr:NAD(P)H-dependent glycerol-3-phosphate dehydrogenase [Micrococcus lylae]WIK82671.1 NAD(P)H-dependent glycerol-3-phosphate dehydrogenase [Micrococcus lylae]SJN26341.1 Glycerol-3-phosphate dehydrogenase [NAD(P)+] [Micrococcus lylae]
MSRPGRVAVLGAGSWGTAFAAVMGSSTSPEGRRADRIVLWSRRREIADAITLGHRNPEYLPDIDLPENISAVTDIHEAVTDAAVVVVAVPAQHVRETLTTVKDSIAEDAIVVSLVKGLERGTGERPSQVCASALGVPPERFAVVSGPNLALEIARGEPTATVVASESAETAEAIAAMTAGRTFRPYTNTDVVGVEIGGIVKNVIALAVGICDGQGLGDNSKASVITRGLAETTRLAIAVGGRPETMAGLAGLGDLVATCASPLSRNRSAGRLIGTGMGVDEAVASMKQTAEGIKSVSAVVDLARRHDVEMPISEAINAVVSGRLEVATLADLLLSRNLKSEGHRA